MRFIIALREKKTYFWIAAFRRNIRRNRISDFNLGRDRNIAMSLDGNVLSYIFGFLEAHDIGRCARVCKAWKDVSSLDVLWLPLVRDLARSIDPSGETAAAWGICDEYRIIRNGPELRDLYSRAWRVSKFSRPYGKVYVNADTGRAAALCVDPLNITYCGHVVRGPASARGADARRAACEAHKRALSKCSNPKKRKFSLMKGKKCYLHRDEVWWSHHTLGW